MLIPFKKIILSAVFNFSLFAFLIIGIQNSSNSRKVNLIILETIYLPISFIIGVSFISGSLVGSFLTPSLKNESD
tara:strand:+ start:136 stop:360 length:225 start_codon:yes stop_codon:yes gene_type:complete